MYAELIQDGVDEMEPTAAGGTCCGDGNLPSEPVY